LTTKTEANGKRKFPPCRSACPAHVNVQAYVSLIQKGKYQEAVDIIRSDMPFPAICGRVCFSPCEKACVRNNVDQPLAVHALKKFVADFEMLQGTAKPTQIPKTHSEQIAVIGAGPAGLTAAYELTKQGYPVTVFERMPETGGKMRYTIPESRLEKIIVENEATYIKNLGVKIETGVALGKDITLDGLFEKGYKAVFLAIGTQKEMDLTGSGVPEALQGEKARMPTIITEPLTLETTIKGVFAGGDVATGPSSIILSVAQGKRAAVSINLFLSGADMRSGREESFEKTTWAKDKAVKKKERRLSPGSVQVSGSLDGLRDYIVEAEKEAKFEAYRCLGCGPCAECLGTTDLCEGDKAMVDEARCIGCNVCAVVCPFGAASKDENNIAQVAGELCKGCGLCAARCPVKAITMKKLNGDRIISLALATSRSR
jgi:NADPH-dependent glutamate synthase beta subunit-like oxidoreductase/Pyruvate/2-oxoacid:ferredoxin oxidoreductase delta subunit